MNEKVKHICIWMWIMQSLKTTCTKEYKGFGYLGVIYSDIVGWIINQNIKSLHNVGFEMKK